MRALVPASAPAASRTALPLSDRPSLAADPSALDLPGPSRRVRVEPMELPIPARPAAPAPADDPTPTPDPAREPFREPEREPVPA